MLLAVDIGNTNIKFGIYDGEDLVQTFHIPTRSDLASISLAEKIKHSIANSLICSVVPEVNESLANHIEAELGCTPTILKMMPTSALRSDTNLGLLPEPTVW